MPIALKEWHKLIGMNALENSLCVSCEHLMYCSLTDDKRSIWSCSDYETSEVLDPTIYGRLTKNVLQIEADDATLFV